MKISKKQKAWLENTFKSLSLTIDNLKQILEQTTDPRVVFPVVNKVEDKIFKYVSAKHKIAGTYYSEEWTKDYRLLKHLIAIALIQEKPIAEKFLSDWLIDDPEELEWITK